MPRDMRQGAPMGEAPAGACVPVRSAVRVAAAVAVRPHLWVTAVRQVIALAPSGWWRRRPFLPVPDPGYLAFRLEAMYGGSSPAPVPSDVVTYLEWCRNHRQTLR